MMSLSLSLSSRPCWSALIIRFRSEHRRVRGGCASPRNTLPKLSAKEEAHRARTGRPRRGATAVRPSSEGGTAGANRLGRHGRRSPPRRRLRSERMERPRACPTHSSRAAAPPALVARAGSLAASCRMATVPLCRSAAERRRVYQFTRLARGTCALRDLPSGTGSRVGTGMGTGAASGRVGGTYPVNPPPMDRHCSAAKHERKPRLARSATGVAPGHVAEEGVC
jgi:hypothetical protein